MSNEGNKQGKPKMPDAPKNMNFYWIYGVIAVILIGMMFFNGSSDGKETDFTRFKQFSESHLIEKVEYDGGTALIYLNQAGKDSLKNELGKAGGMKGFTRSAEYWFNIPPGEEFVKEIQQSGEKNGFMVRYQPPNETAQGLIWWIVMLGVMIVGWIFIMRRMGGGAGGGGGQIFNIGKSKATLFEKGKGTQVTFNDVAGLEGAKEEVQEIVDFLKNPKKYTELGAKIPKGALLVGPPGTGKTLLAKAVAGEAQVPFFSLSGSDFVEMFVGVGASRVRDLFRQAKEKAPAIIFIDEIDAIGRARSKNLNFGSNDERENTLNQLLTEMDGFGTNSGVIILAATNRADILDKALLRAGRFDRQIYVDMPDIKERVQIFNVHLEKVKKDDTIDVDFMARQTPGFSGADIANVCNEAALIAARKGHAAVERQDFLDAVDRIIGGLEKKNKIITIEEKRTIAYHESGHAIVSWLLRYASPLVKVTIVPRGRSLGAAWYLPEERQITTTEQILDDMCAALGGRAAEEVAFGKISTGALSDLEKVTKQAYAMVTIYGLNEKIGNRSYYDSTGDSQFQKPYSDETAKIIDEETSKIIEAAYVKAKELLSTHRDQLDRLAEKLLEKEVIFKDDLEAVLGARPWVEEAKVESAPPALENPAEEADSNVDGGVNE
ncbi:MAG: ATP-dependent zinc metalloprotease FtsH [Bacteroidetes bacterium]|nr:ATP-dependent zinc metalloprotease FtsH [Bacteroidota bacterium]